MEFEVAKLVEPRKLETIFCGGGTPSLFAAKYFKQLLTEIGQQIEFDENIEITMEANPGAIEHDSFDQYLDAGINRLSLGIQTFQPELLTTIGRIHSSNDCMTAFRQARKSGFENINLDLMFGLPGQSLADLKDDVSTAIALNPEHISCYQLTLEPNTLFHRFPPDLPDQDAIFEMQEWLQKALSDSGYQQYEVSAYGKKSRQCQHNLNYWQFGDYIGIGAGAHGKISSLQGIYRSWKNKHPERYLSLIETSGSAEMEMTQLQQQQIIFEFCLNGLRLKNGFEVALFEAHTQLQQEDLLHALKNALHNDLLDDSGGRIKCTDTGYLFLDDILQGLLPDV